MFVRANGQPVSLTEEDHRNAEEIVARMMPTRYEGPFVGYSFVPIVMGHTFCRR